MLTPRRDPILSRPTGEKLTDLLLLLRGPLALMLLVLLKRCTFGGSVVPACPVSCADAHVSIS